MPGHQYGGRHELGQNFLIDRDVIATIERLVARSRPAAETIIEIGPGDGALTVPLSRSGRPITAVEFDPKRARRVDRRTPAHVVVVRDDILRFRFPKHPHVIVGNLPFHLTTPVLRRILDAPNWHAAVLLVQWEVARRRAGVGGATLLTASWWPWYEFELHGRVPARSFRPVPSVDGGVLSISRRPVPLVADREAYQRFVKQVFTGRGRGVREIVLRTGRVGGVALREWAREWQVPPDALPKQLTARQWSSLWSIVAGRRGR